MIPTTTLTTLSNTLSDTPVASVAQPPNMLPKTPTGIKGLDEITLGGLPKGRPTLVYGGAGCGKISTLPGQAGRTQPHTILAPLTTIPLSMDSVLASH